MRSRIVKQQNLSIKKSRLDYWNYVNRREDKQESILANPDLLPMIDEEERSEELLAILSVLDDGGEQILTPRERRAFQLVVREGLSERIAAKKMNCKQATIQEFVCKAAVKLRKLTLSKRTYCTQG
jgi:DNA-directed RNA polymerase specialized sigma24 family protein